MLSVLKKMCCVFLKTESLIQPDYVSENVKVECGRQRTCQNIGVNWISKYI